MIIPTRSVAFLFLLVPALLFAQKIVPAGPPRLLDIRPETVPLGEPKKMKMPDPVRVPAYNNLTPVTAPTDVPFTNPAPLSLKAPKKVQAKAKVVYMLPPKPVVAGPWQFKDKSVFNISVMDVDQGLSSSYLGTPVEDKEGNIWMTTSGVGVNMYDGKNIYVITEKHGLPYNYPNDLCCDKTGTIWIAFGKYGIGAYDGKILRRYEQKNGFPFSSANSIKPDSKGNLWISSGDGLARFDGSSFTVYDTACGLPTNSIHGIFEDSKGLIWISTGEGVLRYDGTDFYHFGPDQGIVTRAVYGILEDKDGSMWFAAANDGIYIFSNGSMTHFTKNEGLPGNNIGGMLADRSGNIWFSSHTFGLCMFDRVHVHHFGTAEGLPGIKVNGMYEDRKGNIWAGTFGSGLLRFNRKPFANYTMDQQMISNNPVSFCYDKQGRLWIGSNDNGYMIKEESGNAFYTHNGRNNCVRSLACDSAGNVWLGCWGDGVMKCDGEYEYVYSLGQGLTGDAILGLCIDHKGNIWLGTDGAGVNVIEGNKLKRITIKEGFPVRSSWKIYEDRQHNIWLGTWREGVIKYDGQHFYQYSTPEGLSNHIVMSIFQDSRNRMWFGTNGGGVNMFDGKNFYHFTADDGLASEKVWSVLEDKKGRIWISTERGVSSITEKDGRFMVNSYEKPDGIKGLDYYNNAGFTDSAGVLHWGSGKCLVTYDPSGELDSPVVPGIKINAVSIGGRLINWNNYRFVTGVDTLFLPKDTYLLSKVLPPDTSLIAKNGIRYSGLQSVFGIPTGLVLPYDQNHITFSFAGTDWNDEHRITYRYMLEGVDADWTSSTSRTEADYRNLAPGDYNFNVKAVSRFGVESEAASFAFTIVSPWWKTWWFFTLEAAGLILLAASVIKSRERALRKRNQKLEHTVKERTLELVNQKLIVEQKNKDITDSINYARRIQSAMLVPHNVIRKKLPYSFILYKPKDIVSGDFYFYAECNGKLIIAAVDCTGHGVPGAFMSMIGNELLEHIVNQQKITDTSKILTELHRNILVTLNRDETMEKSKDGMDVSILSIDLEKKEVQFSGAARPMYYTRDGILHEVKGERWSIGGVKEVGVPFESKIIKVSGQATFYIFTDGFADQFGSKDGKKLKTKNFKRMIEGLQRTLVIDQGTELDKQLTQWQGEHEQVDDILVIGIRVN